MKTRRSSIALGLLLVLGGVLFLLMNFEVIPSGQPLIWAALFGLGGLGFLSYLLTSQAHWWPVIPGLTLLGLSALITVDTLFPALGDTWGPAIFPAGPQVTLAVVALVENAFAERADGDLTGGLFMIGLGLTFGLIYLLPSGDNPQRWALIPSGVLVVMGLLIGAAAADILAYIIPALLILVGAYLLLRTTRQQ